MQSPQGIAMKHLRPLAIASLSFCLIGTAYGPPARADRSLQYLWGGAVLKSEGFKVRDRVFPLPPGNWTLVEREDFTGHPNDDPTDSGRESSAAYFIQIDGKTLVATASFRLGLHPLVGGGTWTIQPCAARDPLYRNAFKSDPTHPECLLVDYATSAQPKGPPWLQRTIDKWRATEGLRGPVTWLQATYSNYQSNDYMVATYSINPEYLGGFPPPKDVRWNVNDWYVDNVAKSQVRAAFVADWIKWSEAAAAAYRQSMAPIYPNMPMPASRPLPPLPRRAVSTGDSTAANAAPQSTPTAAQTK
jgi:hypothetical protein